MKSLIATLFTIVLCSGTYAQINILEQLQVPNMLDYCWEEHGDHYYFATKQEAGPLNTVLGIKATRLSLNKYNKNTHQLVSSLYIAGDTLQNDSIVPGIYMEMSGKYIHINYTVRQGINNQIGVRSNHYVKLDTSLNIIVPDRVLPEVTGLLPIGGLATKEEGGCIIGYYANPVIPGGTAKYLILDDSGNATGNDTLGARDIGGHFPSIGFRELAELPNHNYIATGWDMAGEHHSPLLFGFVLYNADMQILDTFNFKHGLEQDPEAYTTNIATPRMIGLPSGSLISANNDHLSDPPLPEPNYPVFPKIIKHTAATRYSIDDYIAFGPVDNTDTAHGNYTALRSIAYNPYDNNLYYASITHMSDHGIQCNNNNAEKSFLEIISVDTNLNLRWKKYIKGPGTCSFIGTISVPDDRAGILIAGISYHGAALDTSWVYYINDQTPSDTPTAIADITLKKEDGFVLYPNPANNEVHLISDKALKEASLYDLSGRFILSKPFASGKADININQLSPGIYILKAKDKSGRVYQKKLVKK